MRDALTSAGVALANVVVWGLLALLIGGCSMTVLTAPPETRLGPPPYKIGDLTINIASYREVQRQCGRHYNVDGRPLLVAGCYNAVTHTITTTENVWSLLHEFKHVVEDAWHE